MEKRITRAGWRIVLLASLGGTLEFYDFVVFGIFAKDIADTIFPNPTPLISLIQSYATFAVGYSRGPPAASSSATSAIASAGGLCSWYRSS